MRAAGFDAISIWPRDAQGLGTDEVRRAIHEAKLVVTDLEVMANWLPGQADAEGMFAAMARPTTPERMLPLAHDLGAATVSACDLVNVPLTALELSRHFARVCDMAVDHGVRIALEFVPTGAIRDLATAMEIVERADRANGGLMVDTWHFFRSGSSLQTLAQVPGDRIFSVQLNDAAAKPEADLNLGMISRRLPGEGEFDLKGFMQAIAATGTIAPVGIEAFSAALDALPVGDASRQCAVSLDYCLAML